LSIWGVVRTMTAQEDCARLHCARQDFETFLPKFRSYVLSKGGRRPVVRCLFPGYLFVKIVDHWYSLRGTRGVIDVLRDGDKPAAVPESEIHYLRERYGESGAYEITASRFRSGQSVRAVSGVWRDNVGTFESLGARDRVHVLFEMMGRKVPVELGERELAAA
jgi:transcription elongation factor/antiterminator RfaH